MATEFKGAARDAAMPPGLTAESVRAQLAKVLASECFIHSERLSRFLRFSVEQVLAGQENKLKEYLIGVEVFDRQESFDPRIDSIVRVEARRLRSKLDQYYDTQGRDDELQIQFQKGGYVPAFRFRRQRPAPPQAIASKPQVHDWRTLAVLPFENLSADSANSYFAEGLTQEVLGALTKIKGLRVAARTSSFQFRGHTADIQRVGEELNVDTILAGTVRRDGSRARITLQLANVAGGYYVWSETYERDLADIFGVQEEIASRVSRAVQSRVGPEGENETDENPAAPALDSYAQGLFSLDRPDPERLERAIGHFRRATVEERFPAAAWAGLSLAHAMRTLYGAVRPSDGMPQAREAAGTALALEPDSAEAHAASGLIHAMYDWNWEAAGAEFRQAIAADAESALAHGLYGLGLAGRGLLDDALEEMRIAEDLAPRSQLAQAGLARVLYFRREFDRSIEQYERILSYEPALAHALAGLCLSCLHCGMYREAVEAGERAVLSSREAVFANSTLAVAYARAGRRADAERILDKLAAESRRSYVSGSYLAWIFGALGDMDGALLHLTRAVEDRCGHLLWFRVSPLFDWLQADARFAALLRRLDEPARPLSAGDLV